MFKGKDLAYHAQRIDNITYRRWQSLCHAAQHATGALLDSHLPAAAGTTTYRGAVHLGVQLTRQPEHIRMALARWRLFTTSNVYKRWRMGVGSQSFGP